MTVTAVSCVVFKQSATHRDEGAGEDTTYIAFKALRLTKISRIRILEL